MESVVAGVLEKEIVVKKADAPSRAQRLLAINDVLFQTVRPYQKNNYFFDVEKEIPSVASTGYAQLRTSQNANFLYQLINTQNFTDDVLVRCTGSSYPAINSNDMKEIVVKYPSLDEQNKIASFLKIVDSRIEKQQALVDALKLYKRGVLSQIFNQSLSFDGSATRWQKKTIGDIFAERCERANGDEELLAVTINTGIQKRDDIDKKDNSSENKSNYKKVYPGDIAYNTMRMWQGASGYSSFDGIVSPAYTVIYPIEPNKQNIVFWAYYFKDLDLIKKFQKYSQGLTSDTWNLKFAQLADIHIYEPPYETQCNIANFLTKFDNKITIAEHYCNKLHSIKHGLLNSMFI